MKETTQEKIAKLFELIYKGEENPEAIQEQIENLGSQK